METGEIDAIRAQRPAFISSNTKCFQNNYVTKSIYRHNRHYGNVFIIQYFNTLNERDREIAEQLGQMLSYSPFTQRDYAKECPMGLVFIEELLSGAELSGNSTLKAEAAQNSNSYLCTSNTSCIGVPT